MVHDPAPRLLYRYPTQGKDAPETPAAMHGQSVDGKTFRGPHRGPKGLSKTPAITSV